MGIFVKKNKLNNSSKWFIFGHKRDRSFKLRSFCLHIMRINLFRHLKRLLSNATNNINQIVKTTNTTVFNLFELKKCNLMEFQYKKRHEYTQMMKMIYNYSMKGCSDNSILIGNIMRQVLEAFSTFEYKKGIAEVSTDSNIINKLDVEYQDYFRNLMYRLILNGGSHKEEEIRSGRLDIFTVISDDEKVRTAKVILCFMYLLNDMHVIAHLGNIREELNKWCDEIKNGCFL